MKTHSTNMDPPGFFLFFRDYNLPTLATADAKKKKKGVSLEIGSVCWIQANILELGIWASWVEVPARIPASV